MTSPNRPRPRVATVTLNWNGLTDTLACVESLLAQRSADFEIHVVDNGSRNDEASAIAARFGNRIRLHRSPTNLGFCGGNNLAMASILAEGRCDYIALLNNDAEAESDWLAALVAAAEADARVGLCASHMVFHREPSVTENSGIDLLTTGEAVPRHRDRPAWESARAGRPLGACGGAVLYRASMLRALGLFRDDFFANFEDVDLSLRALATGWECVFVPGPTVRHHLNRSIVKVRDDAFRIRSVRNLTTAYWVNMPRTVIALNLPWLLVTALIPPIAFLIGQRDLARILHLARAQCWRERRHILAARRALRPLRRGNPLRIWWRQRSFLGTYLRYFVDVVVLRRRRYME